MGGMYVFHGYLVTHRVAAILWHVGTRDVQYALRRPHASGAAHHIKQQVLNAQNVRYLGQLDKMLGHMLHALKSVERRQRCVVGGVPEAWMPTAFGVQRTATSTPQLSTIFTGTGNAHPVIVKLELWAGFPSMALILRYHSIFQ